MTEQPDNGMLLAAIQEIFQRFDGIDQRFDGIDQRFDGIDQRLDRLEATTNDGFSRLDREMSHMYELMTASAGDTNRVATELLRHLNDHKAA